MGDDELRKLEIRLGHWIEHSGEHGKQYNEAARRAGEAGQSAVQDHLLKAAQAMDEAVTALEKALAALSRRPD